MRHLITTITVAVVALVWLTDPVARLLAVLWPIYTVAAGTVIACAALAASMWLIGRGFRSIRPAPPTYEIIPPDPAGRLLFARDASPQAQAAEAVEPDQPAPDQDQLRIVAWNRNTLLFCYIANRDHDFSLDHMKDHVTDPAWRKFVGVLKAPPHTILVATKAGTWWAAGWTYGRLKAELNAGVLALPYPKAPAPPVYWQRARPTNAPNTHTKPNRHNKAGGMWLSGDEITAIG